MGEHQAEVVEGKAVPEPKKTTVDAVGRAFSSFMESLEAALVGRGNPIMVRVNDEALAKLDMLVAAGICKSRSESAAFLLQRGIEGSASLYDRIESVTAKISELKQDLLGAAGG